MGKGMQIVSHIPPLRAALAEARRAGKTVGLVPTMGAFHEGHLTLMRRAKADNDVVVVTLFVNPTQFTETEDFTRYPRHLERDAPMAEALGVEFLFTPSPEEMYPSGFDTIVTAQSLSGRLEGASRPGHFQGVATVVTKLLNIAGADRAYFGQKDWQQLQVIRRFAADLNIPTEIIGIPTMREPDGLAMSSRNVRLSPEEREAAVVLARALDEAQTTVNSGIRDASQIAARLRQSITAEPLAHIDYAVVVDPETLGEINILRDSALAAVAVRFGTVRLIDNRLLRAGLDGSAPQPPTPRA